MHVQGDTWGFAPMQTHVGDVLDTWLWLTCGCTPKKPYCSKDLSGDYVIFQEKIFFGTPRIWDMWGCSAALIYQPTIALSIDFSSWLRQNIIFHHFFNFKLTHTLCLYKTMLKRGLFGCDLKQQVTVIALTYCVS